MPSMFEKLAELGLEPMKVGAFIPLSEQELEILESAVGSPLPEEYRTFLIKYGYSLFSTEINCTPAASPLYFGWFFGFPELLTALDGLREVLPDSIIPIGDDRGGNTFCIGIRDADHGKVFFHNHSSGWHADAERLRQLGEAIPANIRHQTVHCIADSFAAFIDQMEPAA